MRGDRTGAERFVDALLPVAAAAAGVAASLPAVWWEPLHYDEAITLQYAVEPAEEIVQGVFVDRGGSVLYFFVEHLTLEWIGGVEGLRLPNLLCFAGAIVAAWALARAHVGPLEAALLAAALAVAPLAVMLATFGRMYSPILLLVLVAALLAERAGRLGGLRRWVTAGAVTGLLVHVHPIAPLFVPAPLLGAWAASRRPARELLREGWPAAAAAAVVAAPYAYQLAVLGSRYRVGRSADLLETTAGRTVPEEALRALAPGGALAAAIVAAAAVVGAVSLARARPRVAVLLVVWVATPIVFFTLVPAENARFYGRYLLPALPAYLLLAVAGCLAVGSLVRRRAVVGALLVAGIVVLGAADVARRLERLRALDLPGLVTAVPADAVMFTSTGMPIADRPPELLDTHVALVRDDVVHVDELPAVDPRHADHVLRDGAANLRAFIANNRRVRTGAWIFRGADHRVELAMARLRRKPLAVAVRVSSTLLLVRTARPLRARTLVEFGVAVRRAWSIRSPADRWAEALITAEQRVLEPPP